MLESNRTHSDDARAMLAAIVDSSHDAIVSKDVNGVITSWNAGAEQLFGYSAEEAIGQPVMMLIPADRPNEEPGILDRIRRGEKIDHYETVRRRKDGSLVDISLTVSPVFNDRGNVVGASKIARDISQQKRMTAALRESERRFREMIDALPAAIYTTDAEGRLTHFNHAAVEVSGRTPELGSDRWCVTWKLFRSDGTPLPHDECPMAVALKTGQLIRGEEIIAERPDGTRLWLQPYPTPLRDEAGNIVGGINMIVDITSRKEAEAAIAALNAQLSADLEATTRMHEVSTLLVRESDSVALLHEILDAGIDMTSADMGCIQLDENGVLKIVAQRGFESSFLEFFDAVHDGEAACGAARKAAERVIVEDVENSPLFAGTTALDVMLEARARAVQSTPLISRTGRVLGMFSTYYREPHRPTERELRFLDVLARQAADYIERNQADEALRKSEEHLSTFLAQLPLGAGAVDLNGRFVVSNARMHAFAPKAIPSLDPERVMRWQGFDEDGNSLPLHDWPPRRALRGETTGLQAEMTFIDDDGRKNWTRVTAAPLRSKAGFIIGASVIMEDIDAIKRADLALRQSEERLRSLVSVITDVPWTTDAKGAFVKPQPVWGAHTGQSWDQMRGFGWLNAVHPDDRERVMTTWRRACETGNLYQAGGLLWHEDSGQYRYFQARATPLLNPDGNISEWVGTYTDVDDEKRRQEHLEKALMERERQVLQAQIVLATAERMAAVGTLASGLAHDINNLLLPLSSRWESLSARSGLATETRGDITAIGALLEHLRLMASNLSLFSRDPTQEGTEGTTDIVSWRTRVQDLIATSLTGGKKRGEQWMRIDWEVAENTPLVAMAPHRLTQAVLNLVNNARDAIAIKHEGTEVTNRPTCAIVIQARANDDGSAVVLKVIDTGMGMSDDIKRRAIEPFFTTKSQGDLANPATNGQGSGIGLSLVHGMLERVGGQLSIESELGKGTTVTMTLPVARASQTTAEQDIPVIARGMRRAKINAPRAKM